MDSRRGFVDSTDNLRHHSQLCPKLIVGEGGWRFALAKPGNSRGISTRNPSHPRLSGQSSLSAEPSPLALRNITMRLDGRLLLRDLPARNAWRRAGSARAVESLFRCELLHVVAQPAVIGMSPPADSASLSVATYASGSLITIAAIKRTKIVVRFFDRPRFVAYIRAGSSSTAPILGAWACFRDTTS